MENHIKMNDLGMPQFEEAAIELDIYIYNYRHGNGYIYNASIDYS